MKIIIFADGDNKIGLGHVIRSLNLATILKTKHRVFFLSEKIESIKILSEKFQTYNLKQDLDIIKGIKPDLLVIDKLKISKKILLQLNSITKNILAIDLIGKDYGLIKYGIPILYPKSSFKHNNEKFDFRYTIINKKFRNYRKNQINKKVNNILIIQGGADTHCFIPKIINALKKNEQNFKYFIILGPSFKCWNKLKKVIEDRMDLKILKNVKNIEKVMSKMDLAISATGMTGLELCYIGVPSIFISAEKFELETAECLERQSFGKNLGFGRNFTKDILNRELENLAKDFQLRKKMNKIGRKLIDGRGLYRITEFINNL